MRTQSRLRELLRAVMTVTAGLSLPVVLRHIVTAARDLTGARYAALGVLDGHGRIEHFLHVGMGEDVVARIGHLPEGKGVLGAVLAESGSVRLDHISAHPVSCGFPPGHPGMTTFLGVPVRVRDRTYGSLYLADRQGVGDTPEPFTAEDEELVQVLASAAGAAVDNARLFEETRQRELWQRAHTEITTALLSGDRDEHPLQVVAEQARLVAQADIAAIALPNPGSDTLVVQVAAGADADALSGWHLPVDASLSGQVYRSGRPVITEDLATNALSYTPGPAWPGALGPGMIVPLTEADRTEGVLFLTRSRGRPGFEPPQLDLLASFAAQAAVARRLAAHRSDAELVQRVADRDELARRLRDRTIREIYAVGLTLHGPATRLASEQQEEVLRVVDRLDAVIKDVGATVFDLGEQQANADRTPPRSGGLG